MRRRYQRVAEGPDDFTTAKRATDAVAVANEVGMMLWLVSAAALAFVAAVVCGPLWR